MNFTTLSLAFIFALIVTGCEDATKPIEVTQTRELTTYDDASGNLNAVMPSTWRRVPSTKFREFNCKFNKSGEVYISVGRGSVASNAERWLKQFGNQDTVDVTKLERIPVAGSNGYILETQGKFQGMRGVNIQDAALLGMLVESQGNLITVKMVGNADEVKAQRENFTKFCQSIQWK